MASPILGVIGIARGLLAGSGGPWRPPQWSNGNLTTLTLTVPTASTSTLTAPGQIGQSTVYVFDAVIRAEDEREVVATRNPVQTGASLTDHAYLLPARITVEIHMSDSMASFTTGQFTENSSRSVSAFQTLQRIQIAMALCQVSTRLSQYSNMLITSLRTEQTAETVASLKAIVTFEQILTATVQQDNGDSGASARPQTTDSAIAGQQLTTAPSAVISDQHNILNAPVGTNIEAGSSVPGGGAWTSGNVADLGQTLN